MIAISGFTCKTQQIFGLRNSLTRRYAGDDSQVRLAPSPRIMTPTFHARNGGPGVNRQFIWDLFYILFGIQIERKGCGWVRFRAVPLYKLFISPCPSLCSSLCLSPLHKLFIGLQRQIKRPTILRWKLVGHDTLWGYHNEPILHNLGYTCVFISFCIMWWQQKKKIMVL